MKQFKIQMLDKDGQLYTGIKLDSVTDEVDRTLMAINLAYNTAKKSSIDGQVKVEEVTLGEKAVNIKEMEYDEGGMVVNLILKQAGYILTDSKGRGYFLIRIKDRIIVKPCANYENGAELAQEMFEEAFGIRTDNKQLLKQLMWNHNLETIVNHFDELVNSEEILVEEDL